MRLTVLVLSMTLAAGTWVAPATAAGQTSQTATIDGAAHDSSGKPYANRPVRTRNVKTGQVMASAKTDANGRFSFTGLTPDTYIVELLNDADRPVGTSIEIPLATVPHAFVTVCAAKDKVVPTTWWRSTPAVLAAAGAVGITAGIARARDEASPSR
jgi:Carboxypeptidase regulatory-like domain